VRICGTHPGTGEMEGRVIFRGQYAEARASFGRFECEEKGEQRPGKKSSYQLMGTQIEGLKKSTEVDRDLPKRSSNKKQRGVERVLRS